MKTQHIQHILSTEGRLDPSDFNALLQTWKLTYNQLVQTKLWQTKVAWAKFTAAGSVGTFRFSSLSKSIVEERLRLAYEAAQKDDELGAELEDMHRKFIARIDSHRGDAVADLLTVATTTEEALN